MAKRKYLREINRQNVALQTIMDQSLDLICTIDSAGRFVDVNKASETLLEFKPDELKGQIFLHFMYPEDALQTENTAENVMSGGSLNNFENRYLHKNGTLVTML